MADIETIAAGWHTDPMGRYAQRYWDGNEWTNHVSDTAGSSEVDPLGIGVGDRGAAHTPVSVGGDQMAESAQAQVYPQGTWPPAAAQTPGYGLPGGGAWAAPQQIVVANASKSPGLAVGSLVLGVGAFFFSLIPLLGFLSIPFAICGVAIGISGVIRANKGYEGKGLSIAGIVTSVAALLVSCVYIFAIGDAVDDADRINSDPIDGFCNMDRYWEDPDC